MKVTVTLSANAGVAIHICGYRIWVDALHTKKQPGFSAVEMPLQKQMLQSEAFQKPDLILCTHCHPDHFSETLISEAKKIWPEATVMLPERYYNDQILIEGEMVPHKFGDLTLRFIRLTHEGKQYAGCIHYGLLISMGGKNILLPGDCSTGAVELADAISGYKIHLALLNFPWLTLSRGQRFVSGVMKPGQTILYHLPFVGDDCFGYRAAAQKAAQSSDNAHLLWEPLQTLQFDI